MRVFLFLLLLLSFRILQTAAQSPDPWLPAQWTAPTPVPPTNADRVVLYTFDSTRTAFGILTRILQAQGFEVEPFDSLHLLAYRVLPDSLRLKGGAALRITVIAATAFPSVLVISSEGVPDLRRLHRLAGPSRARPAGRKVPYPGEPGMDRDAPGTLPQIGFDAMVTIATAYPKARVLYAATQNP